MQRSPEKKEPKPRRKKWMNPKRREKRTRVQATPLVDSTMGSTCGRTAQAIEGTEERPSTGTLEEDQEADMEASTNREEDPRGAEEDSTAIRVEDLEEPSTQMV